MCPCPHLCEQIEVKDTKRQRSAHNNNNNNYVKTKTRKKKNNNKRARRGDTHEKGKKRETNSKNRYGLSFTRRRLIQKPFSRLLIVSREKWVNNIQMSTTHSSSSHSRNALTHSFDLNKTKTQHNRKTFWMFIFGCIFGRWVDSILSSSVNSNIISFILFFSSLLVFIIRNRRDRSFFITENPFRMKFINIFVTRFVFLHFVGNFFKQVATSVNGFYLRNCVFYYVCLLGFYFMGINKSMVVMNGDIVK